MLLRRRLLYNLKDDTPGLIFVYKYGTIHQNYTLGKVGYSTSYGDAYSKGTVTYNSNNITVKSNVSSYGEIGVAPNTKTIPSGYTYLFSCVTNTTYQPTFAMVNINAASSLDTRKNHTESPYSMSVSNSVFTGTLYYFPIDTSVFTSSYWSACMAWSSGTQTSYAFGFAQNKSYAETVPSYL